MHVSADLIAAAEELARRAQGTELEDLAAQLRDDTIEHCANAQQVISAVLTVAGVAASVLNIDVEKRRRLVGLARRVAAGALARSTAPRGLRRPRRECP